MRTPNQKARKPPAPECLELLDEFVKAFLGGLDGWEYKTIELITLEPMAIEKILNDLGKANWELISYAFAEGATGFAVLRRISRPPDRRQGKPTRRTAA